MQSLEVAQRFELQVQTVEEHLLQQPQVDCPVVHRFGPGIYIREVSIPAGTVAVGHRQTTEHVNIMLKGKVTLIKEDGSKELIEAPYFAVLPPGRKVGYIHEDMVWQNIYATEETDIEKLEQMFLDKSPVFQEYMDTLRNMDRETDRDDFFAAIMEMGFTPEEVRAQSEDDSDAIPMPKGSYKFRVYPSMIEGKGLFATADIKNGEFIGLARIGNKRTVVGRYANHAKRPNAVMVLYSNGDIGLQAIQEIKGMKGGQLGDEITVCYRATHSLNEAIACQA